MRELKSGRGGLDKAGAAYRAGVLMSTSLERDDDHPLDVVEHIVTEHEWPFHRQGDDELTFGIEGRWCTYRLWFSWREEGEDMQLACAIEPKIPEPNQPGLAKLLMLVNEKMAIGHFDYWPSEALILFRHALLLRGCNGPMPEQIEDLVALAVAECERFYPAFQFAIWGGRTPEDAIASALLDTVGEA